jgi:sialic acid synthase
VKRIKLVAEIGCNHQGHLGVAKKMIELAAASGAIDYVKFQKREVRELLTAEEFATPHPNPRHSFGESYGLHREFLEFSVEQHQELMDHCQRHAIGYACSVWDRASALKMIPLKLDYLKIPSACNLDFQLLDEVCARFSGDIHISLGMTTAHEANDLLGFLEMRKVLPRTVLYACVSGYPAPPEQSSLLEISRLLEWSAGRLKAVGFSGHHLGGALDVAALTLGASWIERHCTLDKNWKGTDQILSLTVDEFVKLRKELDEVSAALEFKGEDLLPSERLPRLRLKRKSPPPEMGL